MTTLARKFCSYHPDSPFFSASKSEISVDLGDHNGQSITWNVTLAAGTQILLSLADNTGDEAWSNTVSAVTQLVKLGPDCVL